MKREIRCQGDERKLTVDEVAKRLLVLHPPFGKEDGTDKRSGNLITGYAHIAIQTVSHVRKHGL